MNKEWLSAVEIQKEFGYSPSSLKRWEESGQMEGVITRSPGGHRRYSRKGFEGLISSIQKQSTTQVNGLTRGDQFKELGASGLSRFGGSVYTEQLKELRGESGRLTYREMRQDPVISAVFFALIHSLKKSQERIQPASEKDADKQAAEFVESCLADMSFTWADTFTFIVEPTFEQGVSLLELVYKKRLGERPGKYVDDPATSQFNDGKIGWRKWATRPVESLSPGNEWLFDAHGGLQGINQIDADSQEVRPIPIEKLLHFRTTVYPANTPEPPPIHRPAYLPWYYTNNLQEIEGIGIERDVAGLPVMYLGRDTDTQGANSLYELSKNLVTNIRNDEQMGVVIPVPKLGTGDPGEGALLELLASSGTRAHDINAVIERYDKRKALVILAQFIMLGMEQVGSYALSRSQNDMFILAATSWLNSFADIINRHAIPKLMKMNAFPGITGMPRLVFSPLGIPDLAGVSDYVNKLVDKAVLTPDEELERHLRQLADLPEKAELRPETLREPQDERLVEGPEEIKGIGKVQKAEPAGKLSAQGQKALDVTNRTEAEIEKEWRKLQDSIAGGMTIKGAISLYRRNVDRLLDAAFDEAWTIGRGGQFDEDERKQVDIELAAQRAYLDNFSEELVTKLGATSDRQEQGGILLANAARAVMYAGAVWGLYNMAKTFGAPDTSLWAWQGVIDHKSCPPCKEEMAAGARPLSKIKRRPGVDSDCLTNCRHELVRVK